MNSLHVSLMQAISLDTPLQSYDLNTGSPHAGSYQGGATSCVCNNHLRQEEGRMLSRLYTRAAWTARPLAAKTPHRIALMSSSTASGKIDGKLSDGRDVL